MASALYRKITGRKKRTQGRCSRSSCARVESPGFRSFMQEIRMEAIDGRLPAAAQCRPGIQDVDAEPGGLLRCHAVEDARGELMEKGNWSQTGGRKSGSDPNFLG